MNKKLIALPIFLVVLFLASCNTNNDLDNSSMTIIPVDSLSFSCKIDGQLIEIKSPSIITYSWKNGTSKLKKLKHSTKDSVLINYTNSGINKNYRITFGFSECYLLEVDTNFVDVKTSIVKGDLLKPGLYPLQYMEQGFDYDKPTANYCGFHIEIQDLTNYINYTSYVGFRDPNTNTEYADFKSKSSFNMTKLTELKGEAYKYYISKWFFNSEFHCKLYMNSSTSKTVELTDGVLNTVF
jgi:hypothetical protein